MRLYLAFTPYQLLLASAMQIGDGDPPAVIVYGDEAGLLDVLPQLESVLGGATLKVLPGLEGLTGLALHSRSRSNDAAVMRTARASVAASDRVFMFNGLRSESQHLASQLMPGQIEYVEDGLDAYLTEALAISANSRWQSMLHIGVMALPGRIAMGRSRREGLNSLNSLPFQRYHALFPDCIGVGDPAAEIVQIDHGWFTSALERVSPLIHPLVQESGITHLKLLANTERVVDTDSYGESIRQWSGRVRATDQDSRPAVKPHPREHNRQFLTQLSEMGIATLPHEIPAELLTEAMSSDCRIETGPTTFVMTSKIVMPERRIQLEPNCPVSARTFLVGWDPNIEGGDPTRDVQTQAAETTPTHRSSSVHWALRDLRRAEGLSLGPLNNLGPALRACLLAGLSDDSSERLPLETFSSELDSIVREGMAPIAFQLMRHRTAPDGPTCGVFRAVARDLSVRSLKAEAAAGKVFRVLAERGIPASIIKGPAVGPLHPPAWPRFYADIDFIVPRHAFAAAIDACMDQGYVYPESSEPPWAWFDLECREGVNLHGVGNVDIHHHIPPWRFGEGLTAELVIQNSTKVVVAGAEVLVAAPEHSMVIAGLHVLNDLWKNKRGISSWRDIIVLLRLCGEERAAEVFSGLDLGWLFALLTESLERSVPEAGIRAWRSGQPLPKGYRTRLALLGWDGATALSLYRGAWTARLPIPNALAFLLGSAMPAPGYIERRHGSYRTYWNQAGDEARVAMRSLSSEEGADEVRRRRVR